MSKVFNKIEGKITAGKIEKGVDKLKNTSLEELSKQLDKVDRGELRKKISELDVEKIKETKENFEKTKKFSKKASLLRLILCNRVMRGYFRLALSPVP